MWYDYNSNLYYTYGRWYSPLLQQFISEDPKRFGGGDANLFGYVHEDPINATDPLGFDEGGGGGGGCGLLCWV
ncbi:MAG: RHS repeat-associated core domain-containing protein, partial [Candidatus Binataceae bacterium]|nr:RHS repeat-associated core domain-containing protein [Candidatus Binataceae bacterium]